MSELQFTNAVVDLDVSRVSLKATLQQVLVSFLEGLLEFIAERGIAVGHLRLIGIGWRVTERCHSQITV